MKLMCACLIGGAATGARSGDQSGAIESTETRVHLLELYSSQGCSSCPPAEAWVSRLQQQDGLWTRFVPVVFHVDYWDRLGWKDPYALPAYTQRQKEYARNLDLRSLYTPMFVLDGAEYRERRIAPLLAPGEKAGRLRAMPLNSHAFELVYAPLGEAPPVLNVHGSILGFGVPTDVLRGENAGRRLTQDFLALQTRSGAMQHQEGLYRGTLSFETQALPAANPLGIVFWVSDEQQQPVQAVGGPLRQPGEDS